MRQLLENNLVAVCELLRVPSGFVAAVVGPDLILEAVVGPDVTREEVMAVNDWSDALARALAQRTVGQTPLPSRFLAVAAGRSDRRRRGADRRRPRRPVTHDRAPPQPGRASLMEAIRERITRALADRRLQQIVFAMADGRSCDGGHHADHRAGRESRQRD